MSSEVATLIGVSSMLLALITIFVTIRFFVRSFLLRSLDWDDGKDPQVPFLLVMESNPVKALVLLSWVRHLFLISENSLILLVPHGSPLEHSNSQ